MSCGDTTTFAGALNTYAPRVGMTACLPCKGGTRPVDSDGSSETAVAGPDTCVACLAGEYRSFFDKT